ncbi:hypothetical protein GCM10009816_07160 [Microbacterium aquimaris]
MLILGAVSAAAAGASAIITWVSRADTIAAADRATKAEKAALSAWRDSATALKEANETQGGQRAGGRAARGEIC